MGHIENVAHKNASICSNISILNALTPADMLDVPVSIPIALKCVFRSVFCWLFGFSWLWICL